MSSHFDLTTFTNPPIRPLTISGTDFKDPDNATMRFWAANVVAFYPDQTTATAFARNIAASGVNLVRLHHMMRPSLDWNWTSQIAALSNYAGNSSRAQPTGKDQVAWDRFDYLTSKFYENGIYLMLSFDFTRTYLPGDVAIMNTTQQDQTAWSAGMQALSDWSNAAWYETVDKWRMLPMIDERCARLQEEFITQLLTRNNSNLNKTYGASEQILGIEILNECSSFYTIVNGNRYESTAHPAVNYFQNALISKWNSYLASNGVSPTFDLYAPGNDTQQAIRAAFLNKLDADHRARIVALVASLGFSRNVTFSNLWRSESDSKAHWSIGPYSEDHTYLPASIVDAMPYSSHFNNGGASPEPQEDFIYAMCVQNAFDDKPYLIGEINYPVGFSSADRDRRTMMQVAAAGYGVLQGWSGIAWFAWNHGDRHVAADGWGTDERLSPSDDEVAGDMIQDAARLDHFRTCAALFRNGVLSESTSPLTLTVDDPVWNSFGWPPAPKYKFRPGWQNRSRIRKHYGTKPGGQDSSALMTQNLTNPIVSDTGQISKDIARKQLVIASPTGEAFSGLLDASAPNLLSRLSFGATSGFATAVLVSSDGADLSSSERLLVSRNRAVGSNWQGGPSLKLKNLKPASSSSRWYMRPLRPRELAGSGAPEPVAIDANGYLDLPATAAWREAELIYMTDTTTIHTDQPEVVTYTGDGSDLQAAIDAAMATGKSLYLAAGTYDVWNIGIGAPVRIFGTPGKVIIRPAAGSLYAFYLGGFGEVTLEGLIFDGAGRSLSVDPGLPFQSIVAVKRSQAANSHLRVRDCVFRNSPYAGLQLYGVGADIERNRFESVGSGIVCRDNDGVRILDNDFNSIIGNAIYLDRSAFGRDGTTISRNRISTVTQSDPTSTGWEGNGILVYNAGNVQITENWTTGCAYSSIRANYTSGVQIIGNTCLSGGETAIYVEAAGSAQLTSGHGAVIVGNQIDDTATGISLVNYNMNGRLGLCSGNLVRNAQVKAINVGATNQSSGGGFGVIVEADCNVTGNVIENAARMGVILGTNGFTNDLLCTGNLIRNSAIGIGFADSVPIDGRDVQVYIASNMVAHYINDAAHGAVVPVGYDGVLGYIRGTGADIGQDDTSTTYPYVRVDRNRCF